MTLLIAALAFLFGCSAKPERAAQTNDTIESKENILSFNQSQDKIIAGGVLGVLLSVDEGEHWNWIHEEGAAHNTALINDKIVVMNISGDLFMSADWGKSWHSGNYFPNEGSYVYETVKRKEFTPPSPSA